MSVNSDTLYRWMGMLGDDDCHQELGEEMLEAYLDALRAEMPTTPVGSPASGVFPLDVLPDRTCPECRCSMSRHVAVFPKVPSDKAVGRWECPSSVEGQGASR
jgi:hypothetical protein